MIVIPFINTAFLAVTGATAAGVGCWWSTRWRRGGSIAIGVAVAIGLAVIGVVPWKGELHLAAYGIFMLAGFAAGFVVSRRRVLAIGLDERVLINVTLLAVLGGIIGSRIRFLYEEAPASFFRSADGARLPIRQWLDRAMDFDSGGMVWYGGAVLAGALILAYAAWRRLPLWALADAVIPGAVLGLGIGRIGCFFNGCCFGAPTEMPWGMCPSGSEVSVHPTQLYETLACTVMYVLLAHLWERRRTDGQVFLWGIAGYAAWRFLNESLRGDNVPSSFWGLFPLTTSQATSVDLMLLVAAVAAVRALVSRRRSAIHRTTEEAGSAPAAYVRPPDPL